MFLTRRNIIIIAVIIIALIIVLLALNYFNISDKVNNDEPIVYQANQPNQVVDDNNAAIVDNNQPNEQIITKATAEVSAVAKNFLARYLSFSNDNLNENIELLSSLMTSQMYEKSLVELERRRVAFDTGGYYGVNAKVLKIKQIAGNNIAANYEVSVQLDITNITDERIDYQNYQIELFKKDNNWLVNSVQIIE